MSSAEHRSRFPRLGVILCALLLGASTAGAAQDSALGRDPMDIARYAV